MGKVIVLNKKLQNSIFSHFPLRFLYFFHSSHYSCWYRLFHQFLLLLLDILMLSLTSSSEFIFLTIKFSRSCSLNSPRISKLLSDTPKNPSPHVSGPQSLKLQYYICWSVKIPPPFFFLNMKYATCLIQYFNKSLDFLISTPFLFPIRIYFHLKAVWD